MNRSKPLTHLQARHNILPKIYAGTIIDYLFGFYLDILSFLAPPFWRMNYMK